MNKEIKELFNKYGVKDLKDKNGQSECFNCKNIKHRYSLTWTSFLYEYKEDYYCFDCLLTILLQQENNQLKEQYCERTDCVGRLGNSKKVERLLQENNQLKEKISLLNTTNEKNYNKYCDLLKEKQELRSWLEEQYQEYKETEDERGIVLTSYAIDKLNELEGGKND